MKYLSCIMTLLLVIGCSSGPKMIPEDELKNIVSDLLITDAVLASGDYNKSLGDSVDFYQPVFDKYGYTQSDVAYTIRQLAARKSKPLANMFDEIYAEMISVKSRVEYQFNKKIKFEELAVSHFSDTIYKKDTLVVGKTGNLEFVVKNPVKGYYTFMFIYHGIKEYSIPLRSTVSTLTHKDKKKFNVVEKSWVSRSFSPNQIMKETKVSDSISYDSLIFKIEDPDYKGTHFKIASDSSKSYEFRIVYKPEKKDAIDSYFIWLTGLDVSKSYKYKDSTLYDYVCSKITEDSCALGPVSRR